MLYVSEGVIGLLFLNDTATSEIYTLSLHDALPIYNASGFDKLELAPHLPFEPYPHQTEALAAWKRAGRRGVVVLPTAAGKTYQMGRAHV